VKKSGGSTSWHSELVTSQEAAGFSADELLPAQPHASRSIKAGTGPVAESNDTGARINQPSYPDSQVKPPRLLGQIDIPAVSTSVGEVRTWIRGLLSARHHMAQDDVLLLVSELVANSVCHSDSGRQADGIVTVTVSEVDEAALRVEVTDAGSTSSAPEARHAIDDSSEGGRGLFLVDAIAAKWGWRKCGIGRLTWFEVSSEADHADQ
jgi:serine/threonine-protein kinase RsbW